MSSVVQCHPTAVVHPGAELGVGVKIGPYAVIQPTAIVGDRCEIGVSAVVDDYTSLGAETRLFPHACVGTEPQDLKFGGEVSYLEAGERNVFREFTTANRGTTGGGGVTRIGSDNLFMTCSHIAHDCQIGDHTIFGNGVALAGHVTIQDHVILNAYAGVQQFVRIGAHAYVSAYGGMTKDVVPFARVRGNHARVLGLNSIGLQRRGFEPDVRRQLKRAFRILFRSDLNTSQALEGIATEGLDAPAVEQLVSFIRESEVGIVK